MFGSNQNVIAATFVAKDQASKTVNGLRQNIAKLGGPKFGVLGTAVGGLGAMQFGAFGAAAGFTALVGGAQAAGRALGGAVMAAAREQVNQAKLTAALEANVKGFDGNTAAIERRIQAGEMLSFTDDDLRDALARSVTATKDVETGWDRVTLAMDIARARSMDLGSATDLVNKAALGNTRALKTMGIEVKSGASGYEILEELQRRYAGNAQKYADTAIGSLETLSNIAGDLEEEFGAGMLPTVTQGSKEGAVALNELRDEARGLGEDVGSATKLMLDFANVAVMPGVAGAWKLLFPDRTHAISQFGVEVGHLAKELPTTVDQAFNQAFGGGGLSPSDAVRASFYGYGQTVGGYASEGAGEAFGDHFSDDLVGSLRKGGIRTAAKDMLKDVTWLLNHPGSVVKSVSSINKVLNGKKLAELLGADDPTLREAGRQIQERLTEMLTGVTGVGPSPAHEQGAADAFDYAVGWNTNLPQLNPPNWPRPPVPGRRPAWSNPFGNKNLPGLASGGPADAGETYVVGEHGPEFLHMGGRSGWVDPNRGGVVPHSHPILIKGREVFTAVNEEMGYELSISPSGATNRG